MAAPDNRAAAPEPAPGLSASAVQARVQHVTAARSSGVVAIHTREHWSGQDSVTIGEQSWPARHCPSVLSFLLALDEMSESPGYGVLLTSLRESDLPQDALARLIGRQLHQLLAWDTVRDLFGAQSVDPRVHRQRWMADMLLEHAPLEGYSPTRGPVLDADTVWNWLGRRVLELPNGRPDGQDLFTWAREGAHAEWWRRLEETPRQAFRERLIGSAGALGSAIIGAMEAGHAGELLAIGLVCEVLFDEDGHIRQGQEIAVGRMERFLGGKELPPKAGRQWLEMARNALEQESDTQQYAHIAAAQRLLDELQIGASAQQSSVLEAGLQARFTAFAEALEAGANGNPDIAKLAIALAAVQSHFLAQRDPERMERLEMATRLVRYLAETKADSKAKSGLTELVRRYRNDESYVDWARRCLLGGDAHEGVSRAFEALLQAVRARREKLNEAFAKVLAQWDRRAEQDTPYMPIEAVLEHVVGPFMEQSPVLLLVVDGMDGGTYRELEADLQRRGWELYGRSGEGRIPVALSALPSITQVSRSSLFAGELTPGDGAFEKRRFAAQPALTSRIGSSMPRPVLFHKGELGDEGADLSQAVRNAIEDKRQRVVGVVVNAVDDHLSKSDQVRLRWNAGQFRQVESLLESARVSGRTVVMTSDHGHVMEWATQRPVKAEEARWRPAEGEPMQGEMRFQGPAIQAAVGTDAAFLPWSEAIRYGNKRNGYHGGVALQEVIIPVAVMRPIGWSDEAPSADWEPLPERLPAWWRPQGDTKGAVSEPAVVDPYRSAAEPTAAPPASKQASLFDEGAPASAPSGAGEGLLEQLLASKTLKRQMTAAGKLAPRQEALRTALAELMANHGSLGRKALAVALGQPEFRVRGQLAAMQRVLNIDGYAVIRELPETGEVQLDQRLLAKQFELKS